MLSNAGPLRITATAGTKLVGTSSKIIGHHPLINKEFYNYFNCHHSRSIAGSSFRSLSNIPYCCPPEEPGPCFSPNVADHPLRSTKDHRLGKPLPYQQPNPI